MYILAPVKFATLYTCFQLLYGACTLFSVFTSVVMPVRVCELVHIGTCEKVNTHPTNSAMVMYDVFMHFLT